MTAYIVTAALIVAAIAWMRREWLYCRLFCKVCRKVRELERRNS